MSDVENDLNIMMAKARAAFDGCDMKVLGAVAKFAAAQDVARRELARDMQDIFAPTPQPPPMPLRSLDMMGLDGVNREWAQYRSEAGE